MSSGGRALNGLGGIALTEPYQTPNATYFELGSQTTNDKIRGQKGNSPDRQLRSQSVRFKRIRPEVEHVFSVASCNPILVCIIQPYLVSIS